MAAPSVADLKQLVVEVVACGDADAVALVNGQIDVLWAMQARRGANPDVRYLYTQIAAIDLVLDSLRDKIDVAQTDSSASRRDTFNASSRRDYQAQNTAEATRLANASAASASNSLKTSSTNGASTSSESASATRSHTMSGHDFSHTTNHMHTDRGTHEGIVGTAQDLTIFAEHGEDESGYNWHDFSETRGPPNPNNFSDHRTEHFGIDLGIGSVSLNFTNGESHYSFYTNIQGNGTIVDGRATIIGGALNGQHLADTRKDIDNGLGIVNDLHTQRYGTLLDGYSVRGDGTRSNVHDVTRSLADSSSDSASRASSGATTGTMTESDSATASRTAHMEEQSGAQGTAKGVGHSEAMGAGVLTSALAGTVDYFNQLFNNLQQMRDDVMAEIKRYEGQIVKGRYTLKAMTTKYPANVEPQTALSNSRVLFGEPCASGWPTYNPNL